MDVKDGCAMARRRKSKTPSKSSANTSRRSSERKKKSSVMLTYPSEECDDVVLKKQDIATPATPCKEPLDHIIETPVSCKDIDSTPLIMDQNATPVLCKEKLSPALNIETPIPRKKSRF